MVVSAPEETECLGAGDSSAWQDLSEKLRPKWGGGGGGHEQSNQREQQVQRP